VPALAGRRAHDERTGPPIRGRPASFTLFQFSYYLVRESGPYGLLFNGPLLQA
jgi:hypothetical protein